MSLYQVLLLVLVALIAGFIHNIQLKKSFLIFMSVTFYYWLQPSSSIRNLDFWLPTFTLLISFATYLGMIIYSREKILLTFRDFGFVLVPTLLADLNRYVSLCCITPTLPPTIERVILGVIITLAIFFLLYRVIPQHYDFSFSLFFLLILFLFLKIPSFTLILSRAFHIINHQPLQFSLATDIQWLGISYIILRMLHILIDVHKKRQPIPGFQDYVFYLLFFPALIAGPIDLFPHFVNEISSPSPSNTLRQEGFYRIIIGSFKKFVLADSLAILALSQQNATQISSTLYMWLALIGYSLRIYFDFSGYTDIAIGSGLLIGVRLPENFSAPYRKTNLIQFWNSWHITLANWFRSYFFYPFTRKYQRTKKLPLWLLIFTGQVITMLLIGFWHGITLNFAVWGLWHGIGLFVNNRWADWKRNHPYLLKQNWFFTSLSWILTFSYVSLGWIWFGMSDLHSAMLVFQRLFGLAS